MARRKKASSAEDLMDLIVASRPVVAAAQPGLIGTMVTQTLWKTFAWAFPLAPRARPSMCLSPAASTTMAAMMWWPSTTMPSMQITRSARSFRLRSLSVANCAALASMKRRDIVFLDTPP